MTSRSTRREFLKNSIAASLGAASLAAAPATPGPARPAADGPPGRKARIATVCHGGVFHPSIAENRDYMMGLLDRACALQPDLVCLPETFTTVGTSKSLPRMEKSESVPGPTTDAAARRAKRHRCYVVCPLATFRHGRHFNSAVLLDRDGQIAGIYDKACPVISAPDYTDLEDGLTPGPAEIPIFDLDFGRVAIQICFDLGFPENWEQVRQKGARLVLWPSAYDGGFPLRAFASLHRYYVITSVRFGQSRVIDPCGEILLETGRDNPVICRDVNLDYVVAHTDYHRSIPDKIRAAYGDRVSVRATSQGSNHFIVEPMDPALTCRRLQEEFGFESTFQYHDRHRAIHPLLRAGQPAPPQIALHGNRSKNAKF